MTNIILDDEPKGRGEPPGPGPVIGIGAALVIGAVTLFGFAGREQPTDTFDVAASTSSTTTTTLAPTTTSPLAIGEPITVVHDYADLISGPDINWIERPLPAEVTAVLDIGEHQGRLAVLASTLEPDGNWLLPGATLYLAEPDGSWSEGMEVFGPGRYYRDGSISDAGFTVASIGPGPWGPRTGIPEVHSSPDGIFWETTTLGDDDTRWAIGGIEAGGTATWIVGGVYSDSLRPALDALPDPVRALFAHPGVWMNVSESTVEVLSWDVVLFETTLEEVGLGSSVPDRSWEPRQLVSSDRLTFFELPVDATAEIPGGFGETDGSEVLRWRFEGANQVIESSVDGIAWQSVPVAMPVRPDVASIERVADRYLVRTHDRPNRVSVLTDDEALDHEFDVLATGFSSTRPAVGGAGYLQPTGEFVARTALGPRMVVHDGVEVAIADNGQISVLVDGTTHTFDFLNSGGSNPEGVTFDLATESLVFAADGAELIRVPLSEMATAKRRDVPETGTPGVLYSPDGTEWGWAPLLDAFGASPGDINYAAVGDDAVYVVAGQRSYTAGDFVGNPRIFVGTPSG